MFAQERQGLIYKQIQQEGAVTTGDLVERFQVSIETIRRDLLTMEQQGLLSRVHGGAVLHSDMKNFQTLSHRNQENNEGKRVLALKALDFVKEEDIISIDSGSTAIYFAEALKERFSRLTVVTHSTDVFDILKEHKDFHVIQCGGQYLRQEHAFCGPITLQMLDQIHTQKAFLFPSAISLESGICDFHQDLFMVTCKLLKQAGHVFFMADSSKFEKKALLKLDDMRVEYTYITDDGLSDNLRSLYADNQIFIY